MQKTFKDYNPSISHKFLIRIQSVYDILKSAEKRAADTILENPELTSSSTIVDIARKAKCSEATLVRLARKLGFSGYPEMKATILSTEDDGEYNAFLYDALTSEDDPMTVVDKVFQVAKQSLTDTQSLLDKASYEAALDLVIRAKRLFFMGAGDAYIAAYSAYLKFSRIGRNVGCSKDIDIQLIESSKLTEDDALIVISHSGKTESLYNAAKIAKLNNANIIAITNFPISPIAKIADIVLLTASFTPNTYHEIMSKRIPELSVVETLYINTLLHGDSSAQEILAHSNSALTINKL